MSQWRSEDRFRLPKRSSKNVLPWKHEKVYTQTFLNTEKFVYISPNLLEVCLSYRQEASSVLSTCPLSAGWLGLNHNQVDFNIP